MNFYLILPLLAFAFNGLLVYPVLHSNPRSPINRVFTLFLLSMSLWGLTIFLMRRSPTLDEAFFWEKAVLPTFIGATLFFFHFSFLFSRIHPKRWVLPTAYGSAVLLVILILLGFPVTGMQEKFYGYAPTIAPLFSLYLIFLYSMVVLAFINLRQVYLRATTDEERNRAGYVIAGLICSVLGGTTDFLPVIGIPIYPLGIVGNILFAVLVTIAIVRQHLFDIQVVARRGLTVTLISGATGAIYAGLILLIDELLTLFGLSFPVWLQILVLVSIAMALQPFYRRAQQFVDMWYYRDRYDYLRALERFAQETKDITDLKPIAENLVELSALAMNAKWACVLLSQPFGNRLASSASHGITPDVNLPLQSPLVGWLHQHEQATLSQEIQVLPQWLALPAADLEAWKSLDARVYVPLIGRAGLTGILLLGEKTSADPYSREDLRMLQTATRHAATAMENASLYQEISDELDRGRRRLEALRTAAGRLALEEDPDHALQEIVNVAVHLIEAQYCGLAVLEPDTTMVRLYTSGLTQPEEERFRQFISKMDATALTPGQPKFGPKSDSQRQLWSYVLGSEDQVVGGYIRATFLCKDRYIGVMDLTGKTGNRAFSADDQRVLDLFAVLAGVLLDNVNLYEDVAQERRTLSTIQENMIEGLIVLDSTRRILYCNKAAEAISGVIADESGGKLMEDVWRFQASDFETAQQLETLLQAIGHPPETPTSIEVALVSPQRQELAVTVFPIPVELGSHMTGILIRDITDERDLQRRRDAFVSIASHELRTPMTTILGFSELLLFRDPPAQTRREWLQFIHRDTERLTTIIDDLLNISRIQTGRMTVELEALDLDKVIHSLSVIKSPIPNHVIKVNLAEDLPRIIADQAKLTQVLANLVDNAIKYSPSGGEITISAQGQPQKQRVIVNIADNGIGISQSDQERLFTMFHRINRPETEGIKGTGLGLYIVKEMVELMQGEIWLESTVGQGTTFSFSLPIAGSPAPQDPSSANTTKRQSTGRVMKKGCAEERSPRACPRTK